MKKQLFGFITDMAFSCAPALVAQLKMTTSTFNLVDIEIDGRAFVQ